ncbi:MAG: MATE family efflux transporter [Bryobacteraceae bacterium]|nr:MATE family efflux transporter [Bryobacteraceae bacterium]
MAASAVKQNEARLWPSLLDAIRGTHQDFTDGSIRRAIFLLATPMVLEMLMESLFAIVDVFWVTRLGANAVAAVGLTESMMTLVFSVAIGVSMSATAMVARRIGEKDERGAAVAGAQAILIGAAVALAIGLPGYFLAGRLLGWMGASPELIAEGRRFTAISLGGNVVVMLLFLNNAIFRGAGDAFIAMRVLWFANLVNIALDPCLIFGWGPFPELGLAGAAVATLIGRGLALAYQFWVLLSAGSRVPLRVADFRVAPQVLASLVRVAAPGVAQFVIGHTSWIVLVRFISSFGAAAVAGYTIGLRIFVFVILPSWGLSGAAATMVGQNLGARKPDRAERAVYITAFYNMAFLAAVAVVFIGMPETLVRLFTTDPGVVPYAVDCLWIVGCGNIAYAFGMVMVQAFNGAGDTVTPTIINVIGFWLIEIPLAWTLAFPAGLEVRGVYIAIPIAELIITLMGAAMFIRGRWKLKKI